MSFEVSFGAMCDPLHKQLGLPRKNCGLEQKLADAVTLLKIHQVITEADAHRARLRIVKRLQTLRQGLDTLKAGEE